MSFLLPLWVYTLKAAVAAAVWECVLFCRFVPICEIYDFLFQFSYENEIIMHAQHTEAKEKKYIYIKKEGGLQKCMGSRG